MYLQGDFAANMKLLQHYPSVDIMRVLMRTDDLKHVKKVLVLD